MIIFGEQLLSHFDVVAFFRGLETKIRCYHELPSTEQLRINFSVLHAKTIIVFWQIQRDSFLFYFLTSCQNYHYLSLNKRPGAKKDWIRFIVLVLGSIFSKTAGLLLAIEEWSIQHSRLFHNRQRSMCLICFMFFSKLTIASKD